MAEQNTFSQDLADARKNLLGATGIDFDVPTLAGIRAQLRKTPDESQALGERWAVMEAGLDPSHRSSFALNYHGFLEIEPHEPLTVVCDQWSSPWVRGGLNMLVGREALAQAIEGRAEQLQHSTREAVGESRNVRL